MLLPQRFTWLPALLAAGLCMSSLQSAAQKAETPSTRKEQLTVDALRAAQSANDQIFYTFSHRYKGVKGTPFLVKTWQKADLKLQNGQVLSGVPVKYDVMDNNLMAMRKEGDSLILASGFVKEFVLHNNIVYKPVVMEVDKLYRRYAFQQNGKPVDAYFEVLAEGKEAVLLKRTRKEITRFNKEKSATAYQSQSGFDEIEDKIEYYLFGANGKAIPVKMSRKGLDKALADLGISSPQGLNTDNAAVRSEQELVAAFQTVASVR